jgi:hypothetical protein
MAQPPITLSVDIDARDIARATKRLDRFQGAPLKVRTQKAEQAGMKLFLGPLKARAARHNASGETQRTYSVTKLRPRNYTELGAYKASSKTWYKHFAIVGTNRGIARDPYVDEVRLRYGPKVVAFIREQIMRLA